MIFEFSDFLFSFKLAGEIDKPKRLYFSLEVCVNLWTVIQSPRVLYLKQADKPVPLFFGGQVFYKLCESIVEPTPGFCL